MQYPFELDRRLLGEAVPSVNKKKTASIGVPSHPLEVEWITPKIASKDADGTWSIRESPEVSLVRPKQCRIINLSPQTALNLLAWLKDNRTTLEQLVQEQQY